MFAHMLAFLLLAYHQHHNIRTSSYHRQITFLILKMAFNHRMVREYNGYGKTVIRIVNKMTVEGDQQKKKH